MVRALLREGLDGTQEIWLRLTEAGRLAARAVPVASKPKSLDSAVERFDWPLLDAAREVLVSGPIDWVELGQIHWRVKEVSPHVEIGASSGELCN